MRCNGISIFSNLLLTAVSKGNGYKSMLKRGRQLRYLKVHWDSILAHLANFMMSQSPEALHQMRLAIKRISAFVSLHQHCSMCKDLAPQFEPMLKMFRHAGKIRNAQMSLLLADSHQLADEEFRKNQSDIVFVQTNDFITRNYLLAVTIAKKRCLKRISSMQGKCIIRLFRAELKTISNALAPGWNAEELHLCRRRIKWLLYNSEIFNKRLLKRLNLNTAYLNQLQDTIGKWHDASMALKTLSLIPNSDPQTIAHLKVQVGELIAINRDQTNGFLHKSRRGKKR